MCILLKRGKSNFIEMFLFLYIISSKTKYFNHITFHKSMNFIKIILFINLKGYAENTEMFSIFLKIIVVSTSLLNNCIKRTHFLGFWHIKNVQWAVSRKFSHKYFVEFLSLLLEPLETDWRSLWNCHLSTW